MSWWIRTAVNAVIVSAALGGLVALVVVALAGVSGLGELTP